MDNFPQFVKDNDDDGDQIELPPGFRFHPTDEELITHYLSKKAIDSTFSAKAIGEVDMNKVEPWDMPWKAKIGEKEWYFFCVRDKKYPTGQRTNRATAAGYWKATGKDKEIFRGKSLVGMKKTLVFYMGRAPKGEKTNWVIHEYRLEGKLSIYNQPSTKNEWVICRVFQKTAGGKKVHISGLVRLNSVGNQMDPSVLPPLMECSPYAGAGGNKTSVPEPVHVPCFSNNSNAIDDNPHKSQEIFMSYFNNNNNNNSALYSAVVSSNIRSDIFSRIPLSSLTSWNYSALAQGDQTVIGGLFGNVLSEKKKTVIGGSQLTNGMNEMDVGMGPVLSNREVEPSTSAGPLDCLWDY